MTSLFGTIKNGNIILDVPLALPEGSRVEVSPIQCPKLSLGMSEQDWPTTSEGISALLRRMDQFENGWLSPEDEVIWREELEAARQRDKNAFMFDVARMRTQWE